MQPCHLFGVVWEADPFGVFFSSRWKGFTILTLKIILIGSSKVLLCAGFIVLPADPWVVCHTSAATPKITPVHRSI